MKKLRCGCDADRCIGGWLQWHGAGGRVAQFCFGPDGKESGRATAEFAEGAIPESAFETPSDYSQLKMTDGAQQELSPFALPL